jgi:hypothetical protein
MNGKDKHLCKKWKGHSKQDKHVAYLFNITKEDQTKDMTSYEMLTVPLDHKLDVNSALDMDPVQMIK